MCCIPILPFPAMSLPDHAAMAVKCEMVHSDYSPRRTPPRPVGLLVVSRTPSRAYDFRSGERADALSFLSQNNSLELTRLRFKRAAVIFAVIRSVRIPLIEFEIYEKTSLRHCFSAKFQIGNHRQGRSCRDGQPSEVRRGARPRARRRRPSVALAGLALAPCSAVSSLLSVRTSNAPTFFPIRI